MSEVFFCALKWPSLAIDVNETCSLFRHGEANDKRFQDEAPAWLRMAGGNFYFDACEHGGSLKHLLFIAGGIGINPIFSMLQVGEVLFRCLSEVDEKQRDLE